MKKVLKYTAILFTITLIITLTKVFAYTFNDINLPAFKATHVSRSQEKVSFDTIQCAQKVYAKDVLTGTARDVEIRLHGQTEGALDTNWITITTKATNLNSNNPGSYVLFLRAKKSTITETKYYGHWSPTAIRTAC